MSNLQSYIIAGPTASGKSALAHKIAQEIGGVIINCDSVQIYAGIEVVSASPLADCALVNGCIDGVPYKLFSILSLDMQISVADYLELARGACDAAVAAGRPPVFVGGTGYYINALINGISPMPDIDADIRARARQMVATDIDAVRRMLGDGAPVDSQRVARAAEVLLQTGRHISEFQNMPRSGGFLGDAKKILINPPADVLRERIAMRTRQMMASPIAHSQARAMMAAGWNENRAIGATQLCQYLRGDIDADTCLNTWITKTNQYAKRQRTWFRTQFAADIEISDAHEFICDVNAL